jgi:hypothetical protein
MIIAARYSLKKGEEVIRQRYPELLREIEEIIRSVRARPLKTKRSKEKTMPGRVLYSPKRLNRSFSSEFADRGWTKHRIACEYPLHFYTQKYRSRGLNQGAFREMDFVKKKLGVEVQFGKYAFMVYNVCAIMTIFRNHDFIDVGVEIVPVKEFVDDMSSGVSYFEQLVWDLEARGVADIDVPVLVVGVDAEPTSPGRVREAPPI